MSIITSTQIFKRSSTGKINEWTISITENGDGSYEINTSRGQVGGKIVHDTGKVVKEGKAGRSVLDQVTLQANALIKKKRDAGYTDLETGVSTDTVILPMLAQNFEDHQSKIVYPALAQPKLDGVRCTARMKEGNVEMMSRKGKEFLVMSHIEEALRDILVPGVVLDGELFSDTLTFQRVTGLVRKKELKTEKDIADVKGAVKFNIFDAYFPDEADLTFVERTKRIKSMFASTPDEIRLVESQVVETSDSIDEIHDAYVKDGYEGLMIRNADSIYEVDRRSYGLQKYKKFFDSEYEIVGADEGSGNDAGTVIWICKLAEGDVKFNVRPTGTRAQRTEWFTNAESHIGRMLTVKYQEFTNDGIPRFPVGVGIRDYE